MTIVGFARAGSTLFWKSTALPAADPAAAGGPTPVPPATSAQIAPAMIALAVLAGLAAFAGPVSGYLEDTSAQLFDRAGYVAAVLGPGEEG